MNNSTDSSGKDTLSSPWPLLIALGFALSEVGVLFGLVPVAVTGLVLFGGSCAGILRTTAYVQAIWVPLRVIGVVFVIVGSVLWTTAISVWTIDAVLQLLNSSGVALRGASIFTGGLLLTVGGLLGPKWPSRIIS